MTNAAEPTGSLETALAHTRRLLDSDPAMAAQQADEILKVAPGHPPATLLLATARRRTGDTPGALALLNALAATQPNWAAAHLERGMALTDAGQSQGALVALRRAVELNPLLPDAWRAIGDQLILSGDAEGADAAYAQHIKASTRDPRLLSAAAALVDGRIAQAEGALRAHLKQNPTDVAALRMLAEVAARLGRNSDSEVLLERCLELAPSFHPARHQYAIVLQRQNKAAAALRQLDMLEKIDPRNPSYRNLKAVVLVKIGEYQESIEIYAEVLATHPEHSKLWLMYGHALSTAGREQDGVAAYRKSHQLEPHFGEAYWSLANLKTFRFSAEEKQAMLTQLARGDLSEENRLHFHFAMGKALEDDADYAASFRHYASGNELRRSRLDYAAEEMSAFVRQSMELFSAGFFAARAGYGTPDPAPIFIVGLPRSGSTLIEQILASHSSVEGTMELPDLLAIAGALAGKRKRSEEAIYPQVLATLSAETCRSLGEGYIRDTRIQRKTAKPWFIDKMPNNFLHIGLIRLVLPNAKIIDARRHPMACCFSTFKQHFAEGHRYSYSLEDLGRYYREYVLLMEHFDRAIPGAVHRVIHERLVEDTETEVRRLLSYCGLPFEAACLRFYENRRPVRTPSARQVRRPINREGLEQWRHYEHWLRPLERALGDVLEAYPGAPSF
ncbi:MAG: tetratricopeptide repeat-containing sulfotransferase family protein [Steroidobacteraceae bacterium]